MKKVFKTLKERQEEMQERQQQMQEQQQQAAQEQQQQQIAQAQQIHEQQLAHDDYQAELDRINKKEIALINAESKGVGLPDVDQNAVPDVLEMTKISNDQSKAAKDYQMKMMDIQSKSKQAMDKMSLEREKLQVARENQANDLAVAKENAKGRNSSKKSK
jgi:type II secretory pathway pseudopilin PulG